MERSSFTIDLGAVRRNAETLKRAAGSAELWAVVKAGGLRARRGGHRAGSAGGRGHRALRRHRPRGAPRANGAARARHRHEPGERARGAGGGCGEAELVAADGRVPEGVPVHLKLDTGMGRWGLSELPAPTRDVVAVMSHLASAESDPDFSAIQVERFRAATESLGSLTRHVANSAGTLRYPDARFDAVRCGIALYGISPFGGDPRADGLEPVLRWDSYLALVKRLAAGESTGYGRRFVADQPTWIGIVPVGYADGFRRDMSGTEVSVEGARRRVVGTISMDALAVELPEKLPSARPSRSSATESSSRSTRASRARSATRSRRA